MHQSKRLRARPSLEPLETRLTPATLVNPFTVTYQDADGDAVTIRASRPIFPNEMAANDILTFSAGGVDGTNLIPQQLQLVDLTMATGAQGTRLSVTAVVDAITGGDGLANVGHVAAAGLDLRSVSVDGDLGRIVAGDANLRTAGLAALRVASLGAQGTTTQPAGGTLETDVRGPLSLLYVRGDVVNASVFAHGDPLNVGNKFGTIGKVFVGGDLVGGDAENSGSIFASGGLGSIHVGGGIIGGDGSGSGTFASLSFSRGIGSVFVGNGFVGGGGDDSGGINSNGPIASVLIAGSIVGGTTQSSGRLHAGGTLGPVQVLGDLVGGTGPNSGAIHGSSKVTSVFIGGDVVGGDGFASASLSSAAGYGSLEIVGDLLGGAGEESGRLFVGGRLGRLFVGGDVRTGTGTKSGTVEVGDDVGTIEVLGSVVGTAANPATITARGMARPGLTRDLAIGVLSVGGSVEFARILAGYDFSLHPANADASIGTVEVDGDWVASDLVAGAVAGTDGLFGTADDTRIPGGSRRRLARIASIAVNGTIQGTLAPLDHFGIVAELVGSLSVNGAAVALTPGAHNDDVALGGAGDFRLREL